MKSLLMAVGPSFRNVLLFLVCVSLNSALAAQTISGRVQNQTTNRPAARDQVILLRLGEGMQEEARTQTDAQGAFVLNRNDVNAQYVVRVLHQGVNYDQTVAGTTPLELKVFDAVSRIPGLMGNIGIVEIQSEDNLLKVAEKFSIANNSVPPVTQASPSNFEISVPHGAKVELVEVKGPGGIWVKVSPEAVSGRNDVYRVNFPLRPGETLFMFNYELPYSGSATFHLKLPYPIKGVGVVQPSSMSFKALLPGTFKKPLLSKGLLLEKVIQEPVAGEVPPFQVSGRGSVPQPATSAQVAPPVASTRPSATAHSPQQNPATPSASAHGELWFMLAGIFAILTLGAFAFWRVRRRKITPAVPPKDSLLDALKEQLFQLESDRLRGTVSATEYADTKKALNQSIQRLLNQQSGHQVIGASKETT